MTTWFKIDLKKPDAAKFARERLIGLPYYAKQWTEVFCDPILVKYEQLNGISSEGYTEDSKYYMIYFTLDDIPVHLRSTLFDIRIDGMSTVQVDLMIHLHMRDEEAIEWAKENAVGLKAWNHDNAEITGIGERDGETYFATTVENGEVLRANLFISLFAFYRDVIDPLEWSDETKRTPRIVRAVND